MRDGTFGVTGRMPAAVGRADRQDREPPVRARCSTLCWRNSALDFASLDALLDSLAAPPPLRRAGARQRRHRPRDARRRWRATRRSASWPTAAPGCGCCGKPARSRTSASWPTTRHTHLCGRVFATSGAGRRAAGRLGRRRRSPLAARTEGDLDTLMARLAGDPRLDLRRRARRLAARRRAASRARRATRRTRCPTRCTRRLTARFVDRRAAHLMRKLDESEEDLLSAVTRRGEVVVEGHPVGQVSGFGFEPETQPMPGTRSEREVMLRAARRALREEIPRRVAAAGVRARRRLRPDPVAAHHLDLPGSPPPGAPGREAAEIARLKAGPHPTSRWSTRSLPSSSTAPSANGCACGSRPGSRR